jgi:acetyl esterase/lipase
VAHWLTANGITGIIVKYRVPRRSDKPKGEPARHPLHDAQGAVSLVRGRAKELGLCPDRIGIIGFSAGVHLALATAITSDTRSYPAHDGTE